MRKRMVWLNGKFSSIDDAKVSVFDRGFLYGDGLFEIRDCNADVIYFHKEIPLLM